jgi:dihydrofolate synthase/folylpolyglutamate synthase
MKTLSEWLDDINQWTHGKIDLDLSRIFDIAKKDPSLLKFHCPVITVAGTNGKGSVVKTLETIYSLSGYSVGTYTSPHILRFNERIRYQGLDIDDENLVSCFEYIEKLRGDIPLTFFEFTTLSAFYYFQKMQPDVLILEVGMGGRLDAVNAVDSDVAVVTSVDLDHMDYLGSTRELIGFEKAGIARAQKPLVFMDKTLPLSVENYANKIGADLICLGKDFFYKREVSTWSFSAVSDTHAARDTRAARHPERSRGISSNRLDAYGWRSLGYARDDGD